ncbi:hypothetical protein DY000_02012679 [Brassica cretica]|uniref:Gnk2-homologous domain-containing protein n=1 Tax=Brassica cretica TaxID=69181 RepID=A0ABQ7D1D5_BRACR|nr:hypothetical protein DY000_02012679 [Brassica cretica]
MTSRSESSGLERTTRRQAGTSSVVERTASRSELRCGEDATTSRSNFRCGKDDDKLSCLLCLGYALTQ